MVDRKQALLWPFATLSLLPRLCRLRRVSNKSLLFAEECHCAVTSGYLNAEKEAKLLAKVQLGWNCYESSIYVATLLSFGNCRLHPCPTPHREAVVNAFRALLDPAIVGSFACLKFAMPYLSICWLCYALLCNVLAWLPVCVLVRLRARGTIKSHDRIITRFMLYNFLHEKPVE